MSEVKFEWHGYPEAMGKVARIIEKTTHDAAAAVKLHIVEVDAIDTGNMLNSVNGDMSGPLEGTVSSPAPYSLFVDQGHHLVAWGHDTDRYIPGRFFFRFDEVIPPMLMALDRVF